jgi:hypothetical protein
MRLILNLILFTCIPSLLGWFFLDFILLTQMLNGIIRLSDVAIFCLGNLGWCTLIKCSIQFNVKKHLRFEWMDYIGLFAGALTVIIIAMQALDNDVDAQRFMGPMSLLYLPPLLAAILLYKIAKKVEPMWVLLKK